MKNLKVTSNKSKRSFTLRFVHPEGYTVKHTSFMSKEAFDTNKDNTVKDWTQFLTDRKII